MANVSISKAAKLAGISRTSLYRTYIKSGRITVSKDSSGKKCIETAEIMRVFGELKGDNSTVAVNNSKAASSSVTTVAVDSSLLQAENASLKQQIEELKRDKAWYQSQITELTNSIKLLEAPKPQEPIHSRLWWQFWK